MRYFLGKCKCSNFYNSTKMGKKLQKKVFFGGVLFNKLRGIFQLRHLRDGKSREKTFFRQSSGKSLCEEGQIGGISEIT